MQLIIILIIFFLSTNCTFAKNKSESNQMKLKYRCTLLSDINKKFSQGHLAPAFYHHTGDIVVDRKGVIHYYGNWKNKKLDLSTNHKTINRMGRTEIDNMHSALTIDNVLYMIDERGEDEGVENRVKWKKELQSPIKGSPAWLEDKLAVLTIDNHLYVLDVQSGDLVWSYHNGTSEMIGLHSVSPITAYGMIITPFSNGELIAFDGSGKKLWSYKFPTHLLKTQFTGITTTPEFSDNVLIATNSSSIVALDVRSGNPIWSKPMQVKNMNAHVVVTANNEVIKINPSNGEAIWSTKLSIKNGKLVYGGRYGNYFIVSDKGMMFLLNRESGVIEETVAIPEGVCHHMTFHPPSDNLSAYFTTEKKGVYFCNDILFG